MMMSAEDSVTVKNNNNNKIQSTKYDRRHMKETTIVSRPLHSLQNEKPIGNWSGHLVGRHLGGTREKLMVCGKSWWKVKGDINR